MFILLAMARNFTRLFSPPPPKVIEEVSMKSMPFLSSKAPPLEGIDDRTIAEPNWSPTWCT